MLALPSQPPLPDEVRHALGPGGAAGEAIAAAQKMWEWMSKLRDMNEPSLSTEDLFAMRNDIAILKDGIAELREDSDLVIPDGDGSPQLLEVDVSARWVAVTKTDTDFLSLAEVQVLGE